MICIQSSKEVQGLLPVTIQPNPNLPAAKSLLKNCKTDKSFLSHFLFFCLERILVIVGHEANLLELKVFRPAAIFSYTLSLKSSSICLLIRLHSLHFKKKKKQIKMFCQNSRIIKQFHSFLFKKKTKTLFADALNGVL